MQNEQLTYLTQKFNLFDPTSTVNLLTNIMLSPVQQTSPGWTTPAPNNKSNSPARRDSHIQSGNFKHKQDIKYPPNYTDKSSREQKELA